MINFWKKIKLLLCIGLSCMWAPCIYAEGKTTLVQELTQGSKEILVAKGACATIAECSKKELIFFETESAVVYMNIYQVDDYKDLNEISQLCLKIYESYHGKIGITLSAFHGTHKNERGLFGGKPFAKLILTGEK